MELRDVIKEVGRLKAELDGLLPLKKEWQNRLDKKFRLEWNYNSNHIEGNTLTYGETELLLFFDRTSGDHEMREYEEMKAHDVALKLIYEMADDNERPLNESVIKQLNEIILVRPFWKNAITTDGQETRRLIDIGTYKKLPNSVRLKNGQIFNYPSPDETPILMGELMHFYHNEVSKKQMHPLELAALMHYKFVCIHPFDDGNGRTARLIMNYILLKNGLPPVIVKSKRKDDYLKALNKADAGNTNAFIEFIGLELLWSLNISINAAKGLSIDEDDDIDKEIAIFKRNMLSEPESEYGNTKSLNQMRYFFHESLATLFDNIHTRLSQFDELFSERHFRFRSAGSANFEFVNLTNGLEHLEKLIFSTGHLPVEFNFAYTLNGMLSNQNRSTEQISAELAVRLDEQQFSIAFNPVADSGMNVPVLEHRNYEDGISKKEMNDISASMAKDILAQIRQS